MQRQALTIMEVMVAVALSSFVAAIGFTGVSAFGKANTRAKQFTSETQLITAAMRMAVAKADAGDTTALSALTTPRNWVQPSFSGSTMTMTLASTMSAGQVGGRIDRGLQMNTSDTQLAGGVSSNTLVIAALTIYRP